MKRSLILPLILITSGLSTLSHQQVVAQTDQEAIAVVRSVIKADRRSVVEEVLQLNDAESQKFWPLYDKYRAEMDEVGDELLKLVQDYAATYPDVPQDQAKKLLKDLIDLEKEKISTRASFLKKSGKVLPADRTLRLAQVENRLDLALALELAAEIPLVPVEGDLTGQATDTMVTAEGVPGGVTVSTVEVTATVTAIDKANRRVTLMGADGFKTTVKAGPDVANFDQIRVGDRLRVTETQQLVVAMAKPEDSANDGLDALVALAPLGAKPGGLMAATVQVSATVVAIDTNLRTATLRFDDGTTQTYPVRDDIDLGQRSVGERVVFLVTETVALTMERAQ